MSTLGLLQVVLATVALCFPCGWMGPLAESRFPRETEANAKNVIFVTDGTNFDDVVTLFYVLKSPRVNLVAVYISPNAWASAASSYRHIRNTLYMLGDTFANIPIYLGNHYALIDELDAEVTGGLPKYSYKWSVPTDLTGILGSDTYFGQAYFLPESPFHFDPYNDTVTDEASLPALASYLRGYPADTKFSVLSTGALSAVAKMFADSFRPLFEPLVGQFEELIIMGGAVKVPGNVFSVPGNTKAEFNIYADPHAAHWAMANFSAVGSKVIIVPLDATNSVPLSERFLNTLVDDAVTPEAQLLGRMLIVTRDTWFAPEAFHQTAYLWDPVTAVVMLHSGAVISSRDLWLRVVYQQGPLGPNQGKTRECSAEEKMNGRCFKCSVIFKVNATSVENFLLDAFQSKVNTAKRSPTCPY